LRRTHEEEAVSKPARIAIAAVMTIAVVSAAGISLASSRGTGTQVLRGGGSAPAVPPVTAPPGGAGGSAGDPGQPCGTTTSGSGPDGVVAFTPCPGQEPPVFHPQVVEPTPGMADVHARPFDDATVGSDDVTVRIDFVSGVEPCSVLDHVDVAYGADAVAITLFEGHDPDAGQVACIDIGVFKRVVLTLDAPLAGRRIVDRGA
jgi:hypothetical protein